MIEILAGCKESSLLSQVVVNRNTELVRARAQEVIDILRELPYWEIEKAKMGERIKRESSCPLLTKGKSFVLWKQEDIQGLMILDGAKLSQSLKQLVATGCYFSCTTPATDAPRLYDEIVAGLHKVAGQHAALLGGGDDGVAMYSTNEEAFEVFLASNKGKELVQAAARKARRKSSYSEGDPTPFKCWYCDKEGHPKRDCPTLAEDKKKGVVKRHPWRSSPYRGKGDDGKKTILQGLGVGPGSATERWPSPKIARK